MLPASEARSGASFRVWVASAHFAATWGERMWEFTAGILLMQLTGGRSLQLPAALGFFMLSTVVVLGGRVGGLLDGISAIEGPIVCYAIQSVCIAAAALSTALPDFIGVSPTYAVIATITLSCVSKLASMGSRVAVERRWSKALSRGGTQHEESQRLALFNGRLRTIDLSCKVMAPVGAGVVMSCFGNNAVAIMVAGFNLLAWPVEVFALRRVYSDPWCREQLEEASCQSPKSPAVSADSAAPKQSPFRLYFSQHGLWPSALALSFLHLTVLSFGNVMTAYIITLGVDVSIISFFRSLGEVFGITASIIAPILIKRIGPSKSAVFFIWFQLTMLIPSGIGASSWARGLDPLLSSSLLVGGVGVSRLGLWGFDLSVTQLMQEKTEPPSALGAVSGVQESLCSTFGALGMFSGVVMSDPLQFQYLAFGSLISVASAAVLHTTNVILGERP